MGGIKMKYFCLIMTILISVVLFVTWITPSYDVYTDEFYYNDKQRIRFKVLIPAFIIFLLITCLIFTV